METNEFVPLTDTVMDRAAGFMDSTVGWLLTGTVEAIVPLDVTIPSQGRVDTFSRWATSNFVDVQPLGPLADQNQFVISEVDFQRARDVALAA
jgi:hypothetical protein